MYTDFCEIIPGLLLGSVNDVDDMVRAGADVLVPLTPEAVRHLRPGGIYITSGILDIKEDVAKVSSVPADMGERDMSLRVFLLNEGWRIL